MDTRAAMGLPFFVDMATAEAFDFGAFRGCEVEFLGTN